jgi:hypothetical protein
MDTMKSKANCDGVAFDIFLFMYFYRQKECQEGVIHVGELSQ